MKVLQINAVYRDGSTGIIVKALQDQCYKNCIECSVVYPKPKEKFENSFHIGNILSNKLHAFLSRLGGRQGYFSYISTLRLLKYIDSYAPDVVHLHNLHGNYINVPLLLKYLSKKNLPVVVTHHDCWLFTGGCTHYTKSNCFKWTENCGNCPQRYFGFTGLLRDNSSSILSDKKKLFGSIKNLVSVGVSQWVADESKRSAFAHAKCIAIHSGIDTNFFHPLESETRCKLNLDNKFVILAPSNKWLLEQNKETYYYFANHLTDDMVMLFFGSGMDENRLTDKMHNVGFIKSREQIRDIFNAGDVMINCTREETLSLLNLEVQSSGTPVITYSNTGVKETVDGKCGFAVENGNPVAVWEAMMEIKKYGKQHYTEACQQWVKSEFELDKSYQKYVELYKSLIK